MDVIDLKRYEINTGIFSVFHPILMNKSSFDFLNNFIWNYREEISEIFYACCVKDYSLYKLVCKVINYCK